MFEREVHRRAGPPRFELDAARDAVARREISGRIVAQHEGLAARVEQSRALAAQRLREQEPGLAGHLQRRRVELHELEIRHGGAGPVGHRHAVARGHRRIGRIAVDMARRRRSPAARPRRGPRSSCRLRAESARRCSARPGRRRPAVGHELDDARVIRGLDAGEAPTRGARACGRFPARSRRARAGRGARCARPRSPAPACRPARDRTPRPMPSARARSRALPRRAPRPRAVAESVAGGDRVGGMQRRRIARPDRRGDAPLRVAGVALARLRLRQDEHRPRAGELHGCTQARRSRCR